MLPAPPSTTLVWDWRGSNASSTEVALTPKRPMLVSYNGIAHLEDAANRDCVTYA